MLLLEDLDTLAEATSAWTLAVEWLCGNGLDGCHQVRQVGCEKREARERESESSEDEKEREREQRGREEEGASVLCG